MVTSIDPGAGQVDQLDQLVAAAPVDRRHRDLVRLLAEADVGAGGEVADADDRHVGADPGDRDGEVHRRLDADDVEDERRAVRPDDLADLGGGVRVRTGPRRRRRR